MAPWAKSPHSSPPSAQSWPGGYQRQNGPLFCVPIFPTPGACLSAESLSCCPAPAQCSALSLPPPLTPTPYQLMGVGRGPKARSLVPQPGDEVVSGELYPLSPPTCPHLSVHMQTGYHRPAARVTVGSSEELEVGACAGTILAPSSRLRLAPFLSFLLPSCMNLRDLPSLLRLGFPTWKVHFTLFFNVMLFCS